MMSTGLRGSEPGRLSALALLLCVGVLAAFGAQGADREARFVVKADHRTTLSSQIAARIEALQFGPGERFQAGDVLVRFDCRVFSAERDKVEAELTGIRKKLESHRRLDEMGSIAKLKVASAEAELARTKAELRIARINVDRCTVTAPFDGRVVQRHAREHQSVKRQQELVTIVDHGNLQAEIVVPGKWMTWLDPGQPLKLRVDETGAAVPAHVRTLGAVVDSASQTATIRADPGTAEQSLLPGMSGTAVFSESE